MPHLPRKMDMINQSGTNSKSWLTSANLFSCWSISDCWNKIWRVPVPVDIQDPIHSYLHYIAPIVPIGSLNWMTKRAANGSISSKGILIIVMWCLLLRCFYSQQPLHTWFHWNLSKSLTFFPMPFFSVPSRLLCPLSPQSYCVCDSWPAQTDNFQGSKIDFLGSKVHEIRRWWQPEIPRVPNHLACLKTLQVMGWNTNLKVVQDFWTINSMNDWPTCRTSFSPEHPRNRLRIWLPWRMWRLWKGPL